MLSSMPVRRGLVGAGLAVFLGALLLVALRLLLGFVLLADGMGGMRGMSLANDGGRLGLRRLMHGGAPVIAGQKWVATKWLREGKFE